MQHLVLVHTIQANQNTTWWWCCGCSMYMYIKCIKDVLKVLSKIWRNLEKSLKTSNSLYRGNRDLCICLVKTNLLNLNTFISIWYNKNIYIIMGQTKLIKCRKCQGFWTVYNKTNTVRTEIQSLFHFIDEAGWSHFLFLYAWWNTSLL